MNFYVYVYLDPRKPGTYTYDTLQFNYEPFYVGKGHGNRATRHLRPSFLAKEDNPHKCHIINKIQSEGKEPIIMKVLEGVSELVSLNEEVRIINIIGRRVDGHGPLTNLTLGGNGTKLIGSQNPMYQRNLFQVWEARYGTEEAQRRQILRNERASKTLSENPPWLGKSLPSEMKSKIGASHKGKPLSEEHKRKIGEVGRGKILGPIPLERRKKISEALKGNTNRRKKI